MTLGGKKVELHGREGREGGRREREMSTCNVERENSTVACFHVVIYIIYMYFSVCLGIRESWYYTISWPMIPLRFLKRFLRTLGEMLSPCFCVEPAYQRILYHFTSRECRLREQCWMYLGQRDMEGDTSWTHWRYGKLGLWWLKSNTYMYNCNCTHVQIHCTVYLWWSPVWSVNYSSFMLCLTFLWPTFDKVCPQVLCMSIAVVLPSIVAKLKFLFYLKLQSMVPHIIIPDHLPCHNTCTTHSVDWCSWDWELPGQWPRYWSSH